MVSSGENNYKKYVQLGEKMMFGIVITLWGREFTMNAYRAQNIPGVPFQRKESVLQLSSSTLLLYFSKFILLQCIQV